MIARVNGTELYYETTGVGRPLLLMHGGLGLDHTLFRPWCDPLGDSVELIYYDHRGNGRSQRPESLADVTHDTWVEDANALLDHLGLDRVVLLGHSYGGYLAQEYALQHASRLDGLILCCTAPVVNFREVVRDNALARGTPEALEALLAGTIDPPKDDAAWGSFWRGILPLYFKSFDPRIGEQMHARTIYSAAASQHVLSQCIQHFDVRDRLHEIGTPTLVCSGSDDWITPLALGGEPIHRALPHSELVVFENSGHMPFVEENTLFLKAVREWLARLD